MKHQKYKRSKYKPILSKPKSEVRECECCHKWYPIDDLDYDDGKLKCRGCED